MAHTVGEITSSVVGGCKRFECQVVGLPRPSIRWFKDGANITAQARYKFDYTHDGFVVLILENVKLSDQGIYRCSAHNSEGSAETAATLYVTGTRSDIDEELESIHTMPLPKKKVSADADEDSVLSMESSFESSSVKSSFTSGGADLDELANEFEEIAAMLKLDGSKRRLTTDSGITSRGSSFSSEADAGSLAAEMMQEMKEYLHGKGDVLFESFEQSKVKSFDSSKADPLTIQGEKYEALSQSIKSLKKFATESRSGESVLDIDWDRVKDLEARVNAGKSMIEQRRLSKSERHGTSEMETMESSEHFESFSSESSSSVVQKTTNVAKTNYATTMSEFSSMEMMESDGMLNGHQLEEIKAFDVLKTNGDDMTAKLMQEMKSKKQFTKIEDFDDDFSKPRKGKLQREEKPAGKLDHKVVIDKEGSIMAGKYLLNEAEEVETDESHSISHELHYMYKAESLEESSQGKVPLSTLLKEAVGFDDRLEIQGESKYETISAKKSASTLNEAGVSTQSESYVEESGFDTIDGKLSSLDGVTADSASVDDTDSNLQKSQKGDTDKSYAGLKYTIDADRSTIKVVEGEEINIRWKVKDISTNEISVYKNDLKVSSNGRWEITRKETSCSLKIFSAISTDAASYCIRVGNSEKDEGKVNVKVTSMPTKAGQPEVLVLSDSSEIVAKEKESFKLKWKVTGIEHTKIIIYRNGKKVTLDDRCKLESDGDICNLCVSQAVLDDSATYTIRFNGSDKNYGPIPVKVVPESAAVIQAASSEVLVLEKKTLRIRWTVKGVTHTKITIYKNGKKIAPEDDDRIKTESDGDDFILSVSDASVSDTATYTIGIEETSIDNAPVVALVLAAPTMQQELEDRIMTLTEKEVITHVKEKLKLRWRIKGLRHMKVIVYKNGKVVVADDHTKITYEGDICSLTVDSATMEDSASYSVAVEELETDVAPVVVKVLPEIKVEVMSEGPEVLATEGQLLEIQWKISGVTLSEVAIFKDGQAIKLGGRCKLVQSGDICKLKFPKASITDSASYTVRIGASTEDKGQVQAKVIPEVRVEVSAASSEVTVEEGKKLEMKWTITGVTSDKVTVCKSGQDVKSDEKASVQFDGDVCTLTYATASLAEAATYSVSIDSVTYGEVVAKVTKPEPKVEVVDKDSFEAKEGDKVSLKWKVAGVKPADIRLFRNGERIKPNDQYKLRKEGDVYTLIITSATLEDNATFTIRIGKDGEKDFGKINVKVVAVTVVEETVEKVGKVETKTEIVEESVEKVETKTEIVEESVQKVETKTEVVEESVEKVEKVETKAEVVEESVEKVEKVETKTEVVEESVEKVEKVETKTEIVEGTTVEQVEIVTTESSVEELAEKVVKDTIASAVEETLEKVEKDKSESAPDLSKLPEAQVEILTETTEIKTKLGEKIQMKWKITGVKPSEIRLFKNGERIKPNGEYKLRKEEDVYTLLIKEVSLEHNADFTVRLNKTEVDQGKITVKVEAQEAVEEAVAKTEKDKKDSSPDLSKLPESQVQVVSEITEVSAALGEKVQLQWKITDVKPADIKLFRNGERIKPNSQYKLKKDGDVYTLVVVSAALEDNADFTVKIGKAETDSGKITVKIQTAEAVEETMEKTEKDKAEKEPDLSKLPDLKIEVMTETTKVNKNVGEKVELQWKITGVSSSEISVYKSGQKITANDHTKLSFEADVCTMCIESAITEDTADYNIRVNNVDQDYGKIALQITVDESLKKDKKKPPEKPKKPAKEIDVLVGGSDLTTSEGKVIELEWKITGASKDSVVVCKDKTKLLEDDRYSVLFADDICTLKIHPAVVEDSAIYSVIAENSEKDEGRIKVEVLPAQKKAPEPTVEVTIESSKVSQEEGQDLEVKWKISGTTADKIKVCKAGVEVVTDERVNLSFAADVETMTIKSATVDDSATYCIRVDNSDTDLGAVAITVTAATDKTDAPKESQKPVEEEAVKRETEAVEEAAKKTEEDKPAQVEEDTVQPEKAKKDEKLPEMKEEPKPVEEAITAEKAPKDEKAPETPKEEPKVTEEPVEAKKNDEVKEEAVPVEEKVEKVEKPKAAEKAPETKEEPIKDEPKEEPKKNPKDEAKAVPKDEAIEAEVKVETKEKTKQVTGLSVETLLETSQVTYQQGDDINLEWKVSGVDAAEVAVYKDGDMVVSNDHMTVAVTGEVCSMAIVSAVAEDSATYTVGTLTTATEEGKVTISVVPKSTVEATRAAPESTQEVLVEASVSTVETSAETVSQDFKAIADGSKVTSVEGQDVELKWKLTGIKEAEISLVKDGQDLVKDDHVDITISDDQCTLKIHPSSTADSATYALKVNNSELSSAKVAVEVVSLEESKKSTQPETEAVVEGVEIMETQTEKVKVDVAETVSTVESTVTTDEPVEQSVESAVEIASKTKTDIVELKPGMVADTKQTNIKTEVYTEEEGEMIKETIETFQETVLEGEFEEGMSMEDVVNLQHRETKKEFRVTEDGQGMEISEDIQIVTEVKEEVVPGEGVETIKTVTTEKVKTEEATQKMIKAKKDESEVSTSTEVTEEPKKPKEGNTNLRVEVDTTSEEKTEEGVDVAIATEVLESSKVSLTVDTEEKSSEVGLKVCTQEKQDVKTDIKIEDTQVPQEVSADVETSAEKYPQDAQLVEKATAEKTKDLTDVKEKVKEPSKASEKQEVVEEAIECVKKPKEESLKDMPLDEKAKPEQSEKPQEETIEKVDGKKDMEKPANKKEKPEERLVTEETEKAVIEEIVDAEQKTPKSKPNESLTVQTDVSVSAKTEQNISADSTVTDDVDGSISIAQTEAEKPQDAAKVVEATADVENQSKTKDTSKVSADVEIKSETETKATIGDKNKDNLVEATVDVCDKADSQKVTAEVEIKSETEAEALISDKDKPDSVEVSVDIAEKAKPKEIDSPKASVDIKTKSETEVEASLSAGAKPDTEKASVDVAEKSAPEAKDVPKVSAEVDIKSETEAEALISDKDKPDSVEAAVDVAEKAKPKERDSQKVSADIKTKSETEVEASLSDGAKPDTEKASVDVAEKAAPEAKDVPKVSAEVDIKSETEAEALVSDKDKPDSVEAAADVAEKAKPKEIDSPKVSADIKTKTKTEVEASLSDEAKPVTEKASVGIAEKAAPEAKDVPKVSAEVDIKSETEAEALISDKYKPDSVEAAVDVAEKAKPKESDSPKASVDIKTKSETEVEATVTDKAEPDMTESSVDVAAKTAPETKDVPKVSAEVDIKSETEAEATVSDKSKPDTVDTSVDIAKQTPGTDTDVSVKVSTVIESEAVIQDKAKPKTESVEADISISTDKGKAGQDVDEAITIRQDADQQKPKDADVSAEAVLTDEASTYESQEMPLVPIKIKALPKMEMRLPEPPVMPPLPKEGFKCKAFVEGPEIYRLEGEDIRIKWTFSGKEDTEIVTVCKDGIKMAPDHRVSYIIEENYAVLKIPKAILADSATYCLKLDDKVLDMGQVILWVEPLDRKRDKPSFTRRPAPDTVDGRRLSIRCAVDGYPNPEVTWFLHGEELGQDALFNVYTQDGYHHLGVSDPALLFDEPLVCRVENRAGCTQSVMILKRDGQEVYCEPVLEAVAADTAEEKPRPPTMEAEISETNSTNLHKVKVKESYTDQYNFVTLSAGTQVEVLAKNVPGAILARQADNHDKVCYVANKVIATKTAAASDVSKQESKENATDASQVNKPAETPETQELLSKEEQQDTTMPERRKLKSPSPQMTSTPKLRRREFGRESPEDISRRLGFQDSPSPKKEISYDELDIPDYDDGTTRPMFKKRLKNVEAKPGQRAQLECTVSGEPQPKVLWLKNNRPLKESDNCEVIVEDDRNILVFPNADDSDVGTYTARAMNVNGSAMTTAEFTLTEGRGLPAMPTSDSPMDMDFTTPTYFFQMSSCEVSEGRMARFDCRVVAYPKPDIVWMRDGKVIDPKERFKLLNFNNEIYSLLIQDVHLEDTGRYTCWARNKFGEAMTEAYLNVIAMQDQEPDGEIAPQFLTKFYDQQTTEGIATEFKAFIAGRPEPSVTWLLNDIELRDAPGQRLRHRDGTVCLEMKAPKVTQSGEYTCILKNKKGEAVCSAKLSVIEDKLQGRMLPKFFKKFDHIKAREGEEVKFTCVVVGEPKPNITWMLDHKPIDVSNRRFIQKQDGDVYTLTIKNLKFEDAGMITCKAVNSEGEVYSSANLHIRESKFLEEDAKTKAADETDSKFGYVPTFTKRLQDIKVKEGTKARFDCKVMGIPDPEVSWMKDGRVIAPDHRHRMTREGDHCELVIENVTSADAGVYTCIISNTQGKSSSTAELKLDEPKEDRYVPEKPREDKPAKKERERYSPEPYVKREPYVKKEPYTSPVRPKKTTSFTDKLDTEKFDLPRKSYESPMYTSKYDDYNTTIPKRVYESPIRSYDSPIKTYESPRKTYDSPTRKSYDSPTWKSYESPARTAYDSPTRTAYDSPTRTAYDSPTRRKFDSPARSYVRDEYRHRSLPPKRSYSFEEPVTTRYSSPVRTYGLDEPKRYISQARSYKKEEPKKYVSPYSREEPVKTYDMPSPKPYVPRRKYSLPTNLYQPESKGPVKPTMPMDRPTLTGKREDSVRLSWRSAPTSELPPDGRRISYIVESRELPRSQWSRVASEVPGTTYMVKHLRPDKEYEFRVRAQNLYGLSEPTLMVPLERRQDDTKKYTDLPEMRAPPRLPTYKPVITDLGEETVRLAWRPAETYEAKRIPPVSYRLEAKELPGKDWMPLTSKLRDTTHYLSELSKDRDYMIRVRAENDFGISEPTDSLWLQRARAFPTVPISRPDIIDVEDTRAKLAWSRVDIPSFGPGDVPLTYMLEVQEPMKDWRTIARNLGDTEYVVDGLRPGTDYKFRVRAKTPTGALSDPSPAASLYTTLAKARAPVDRLEVLAYEPDSRSVQLSWQRVHIPPYNYEDQPLMYMVEYNEPPMPDWQPLVSGIPTTRYRVTHLDPMRDYKFRVRALTSYGVSPPSPALPVTLRQAPGSSGYPLPASVTLSDVQPTSARLSWQRPMYDLSRTVHYDVEMLEPPLTVWQRLASGLTDTSFRATGLKPTRDYQFRVIPRVDQRQLEPTAPVSLTSAPVKPRLPIDQPRLSLISPDSCQLSWQPAELPVYHRSKVPIYYKVEMQELPSSAWMPVARRIRDTCYHVTGLRPNKDYKFRISAETDYGMSEPSLPASLYRKPAPKFATNEPLIKDISQNVVQLSWEPADAPSAVGVVSYRVEVQTPPGISTWTTLYANHASPSVRLADLRPDLDYLVRIRAICGDYVSDPTLPIYIPRRATPPRMSNEEPYAVDIGNDYVKLQWRSAYIPSQIMDYAPISYRLEAQELPGGLWTPVAHGIAHTDFKVTGLSPLKDYNFRIRAENDYGVSDPTPAVMIKRRSVEPTLPRDEPMLYDVGPNSIRLSWRPASLPSQLQSLSPLHYTIYVQEPPNKSWRPLVRRVPGTSYHITGLLPDRDYFFRVQAENEHGQSRPTDAAYLPRHSDIKRPISIPEVSDFADDLTSVRLRWKPRAGSPFDAAPNRYLIESWEPVRREWRPVAKGIRDTTYHLRDLPRVPDHLFRVRYETEKAGLSEPSLPISVSRFYSLPKMPVHRPQLDEVDMDSVRLSWMTTYIPDAATRNKVRFYIEQREIPDGTWRTVASDVYDNYYRVRGLKGRSDYEFRVKVNVDGVTSEPSYPVSLFRRPVIPKVKFETPEVVEVDDSTISLKWNKIDVPAFGYDEEPLSFMIERQSLPGYEWTPIATNITGFRHTIRDLKPFQDYKFRVRGIYTSGYTEPSPPVPVYRRPSESKLGYIDVTELEGSQKYSKYQTTPLPTESLHSSTPDVKPKKRVTRRYSSSYEMYDSKDTNIEASFQPSPTPPPAPKFRRENAYVYRRNISPVKEPELFRFQTPEPVIHKELDSNKDLYHWYNKRRASDAGLDLEELRRRRRDSEYDFRMEERRHALLLETENRSRRRPSPVTTPRKTPVVASSSEVGESYASVADRYEDIKCPHIIRPGHWNYPRRRMSVSLDYQDLEKLRQRTYEMEKKYSKSSRSESGNTIYVVEDSADLQHYKKVGHVSRADLVELYPRRGSFSNERDLGYFVISKFSLSVSGLSRTRSHTPPGRYVRPASVEPSPSLVYTRAKSVQPRTRSLTPDYKKYTAATTQSSYTSTKSEKRSSSTEYMRPRSYSISGPSYDSKVKDSRPVSAKDKPKFNRLVENSKSLIANYSTLDKKCEERLEQSYVGYRSRQGSVSQKRSSSIADLKADSRYTSTPRGSVSQSPARIAELKAAAKRRASVSVMTTTRASSVSASRAGSMARIDPSAVASQRRSTISSGVNDDLKIKLDSLTNKLEAQKTKKKPKPVMKVKSFRGEGYVMDDGSWQPKSERLSSMYSKLS